MNAEQIEDIYPLSWMQQGMLFHTLYAPKSGVYFNQLNCTLGAGLNADAFVGAWRRVVERHPVLRTGFVWEDLPEPLQVVRREVELPLERQDWRGLSGEEQRSRFDAFLKEDRGRGFDLSEAPLMRLALIRTGDDAYRFVWSRHHILLDAWSGVLLAKEFNAFYESHAKGLDVRVERPRPFRDYIAWLRRQDMSKAREFWRGDLEGFDAPTPLPGGRRDTHAPSAPASFRDVRTRLTAETTAALQTLARRRRLTLNTVLQGAWALLLSRYCGREDVLFGTTVSGRPVGLAGVEAMVGIFINTLPVRVKTPAGAKLLPWLVELQLRQAEMRQYEYTPLVEVQSWSEVPRGLPLFESILVVQNYPAAGVSGPEGVRATQSSFVERSSYPVAVVVALGTELGLRLTYDENRVEPAAAERAIGHLARLLESVVERPDAALSELEMLRPEESVLLERPTGIEELETSFSF
jgi:hypothetical protein